MSLCIWDGRYLVIETGFNPCGINTRQSLYKEHEPLFPTIKAARFHVWGYDKNIPVTEWIRVGDDCYMAMPLNDATYNYYIVRSNFSNAPEEIQSILNMRLSNRHFSREL